MSISTKEAQLSRKDEVNSDDTCRWVIIPSFELRRSRLALETDSCKEFHQSEKELKSVHNTADENES